MKTTTQRTVPATKCFLKCLYGYYLFDKTD